MHVICRALKFCTFFFLLIFFYFFYAKFISISLFVLLPCISLSLSLSVFHSFVCCGCLFTGCLCLSCLGIYQQGIRVGVFQNRLVQSQIVSLLSLLRPHTQDSSSAIWPIKLFYSLLWLVSNFRTFILFVSVMYLRILLI